MKTLVIFTLFINIIVGNPTNPVVDLPLGSIEGTVQQTFNKREFFAFEGIPYARPPVGKYRFREPVPIKPWIGTWEAKTIYKCLQLNHFTKQGDDMVQGEEDCLYLNIYTPDLNPNEPMNVLFYIHGGAFMFNYAGLHSPELVMDKNIVYVNVNYRLGPLGFLSTEDEIVPGNNGLKDQILALKWVQENIEYFGGDPNSVTIMGNSAGGASVHFHYLMPKSKGLFDRGYSQSGTTLNPWVLMENGLEKSKIIAANVGCPTVQVREMVDCMKRRPGRQIVNSIKLLQPWRYNPFSPFGAVADNWSSNPLIPDHPYKLLLTKQVTDLPWLSTFTSSEGLYPGAEFYPEEILEQIDSRWNEIIPSILDYNYTVSLSNHEQINNKVREFYMKGRRVEQSNFMDLIKMIGDRMFYVDIEKANRLHSMATKSPVYSFQFSYRGASSKSTRSGSTEDFGASHADDLSYIFPSTIMNTLTTKDDRKMTNMLVDMLMSFIETGKPVIGSTKIPAITKKIDQPFSFLNIQAPSKLTVESVDFLGNRNFWEKLPILENEELFTIHKDEL